MHIELIYGRTSAKPFGMIYKSNNIDNEDVFKKKVESHNRNYMARIKHNYDKRVQKSKSYHTDNYIFNKPIKSKEKKLYKPQSDQNRVRKPPPHFSNYDTINQVRSNKPTDNAYILMQMNLNNYISSTIDIIKKLKSLDCDMEPCLNEQCQMHYELYKLFNLDISFVHGFRERHLYPSIVDIDSLNFNLEKSGELNSSGSGYFGIVRGDSDEKRVMSNSLVNLKDSVLSKEEVVDIVEELEQDMLKFVQGLPNIMEPLVKLT
ncbi:hypothetical protein A3Q56_01267 [Intoshia linei]|uniref:Uncharacterized protein n=1 Tax=Intoshia linei TaxID=1819745 RepID=A0A177BBG8_9BILA|nr:hypothetical protein A3Q56_01267 [Intoshia linei]